MRGWVVKENTWERGIAAMRFGAWLRAIAEALKSQAAQPGSARPSLSPPAAGRGRFAAADDRPADSLGFDALHKPVVPAAKPANVASFVPTSFLGPEPHKTFAQRLDDYRRAYGEYTPWLPLLERTLRPLSGAMAELQARRAALIADDPRGHGKHYDVVFWIMNECHAVKQLALDTAPPQSVLDIGCGVGRMAFLCREFGHEVVSIDLETPQQEEIASVLGVKREVVRVEPHVPLPDFGKRFSVVTTLGPMFNYLPSGPGEQMYWSLDQWRFLLADLMWNQMTYPAWLYFDLNRECRDGQSVFNADLLALCAGLGAKVVPERGHVVWRLERPLLSPTGVRHVATPEETAGQRSN
jgi:SAM-dependent methyltransferase